MVNSKKNKEETPKSKSKPKSKATALSTAPEKTSYRTAKQIQRRKNTEHKNILSKKARETFTQPWQMLLMQAFDTLSGNQARALAVLLFAEVFNNSVSNDNSARDATDKNHMSLKVQAIIAGYSGPQSITDVRKKNHVNTIFVMFKECFYEIRKKLTELENQVTIQGLDGSEDVIPAPESIIDKQEIVLTYANIIRSGLSSNKEKMDAAKGLRDVFGWDAKTTGRDNKNPLIAILQLVDGKTKDLNSANILPESSPLLEIPPSERGDEIIEGEYAEEEASSKEDEDLFKI